MTPAKLTGVVPPEKGGTGVTSVEDLKTLVSPCMVVLPNQDGTVSIPEGFGDYSLVWFHGVEMFNGYRWRFDVAFARSYESTTMNDDNEGKVAVVTMTIRNGTYTGDPSGEKVGLYKTSGKLKPYIYEIGETNSASDIECAVFFR